MSAIVNDSITGTSRPAASIASSAAQSAALAFSVSNIVSQSKASTPPSIREIICSLYASTSISNVTLRKAGFSTSGLIEQVRPVGPTEPATKRGLSAVEKLSATSRASSAARRFISAHRCSQQYSPWDIAFALKVQVSMISAPAARYFECISRITSGHVSTMRSLLPLSCIGCPASSAPRKASSSRAYRCIIVPMAPSSTSILSFIASVSFIIFFTSPQHHCGIIDYI